MRYFLLAAGLALAGLLAGCADENASPSVEVTVKAGVCTNKGADCYLLGVPRAEIEVQASDGTVPVTTTTDDAGVARFEVPEGFAGGEVVARSALLDGGRISAPFRNPGPVNGITMAGKLVTPQGLPST